MKKIKAKTLVRSAHHKKVAVFDIDGTVFRSSLLIELVETLIQNGIFSSNVRKEYAKEYEQWLDRKDSYEKYINAVIGVFDKNIKGMREENLESAVKKIISSRRNRLYRYTRNLIADLKKKDYYLLAISNSPRDIVEGFCKKLGFDKVYGRLYEVGENGKFTGQTLFPDIIADKAKVLSRAIEKENLTLKGSVGVGDSEGDIAFLKIVEKPICFNPNQKLYKYAKRAGWKIVVERKDVIYHL